MRYMIVVLSILLSTNMAFAGYSDMSDGLDTAFANGHYLKLDQSSAQTVSGGSPKFSGGITTDDVTSTTSEVEFSDNITVNPSSTQSISTGTEVLSTTSFTYPSISVTDTEKEPTLLIPNSFAVENTSSSWTELSPSVYFTIGSISVENSELDFTGDGIFISASQVTDFYRTGTFNGYTASSSVANRAQQISFSDSSTYTGSTLLYTLDAGVNNDIDSYINFNSPGQTGTRELYGNRIYFTAADTETAGKLDAIYSGIDITVDSSGTTINNGTCETYGIRINNVLGAPGGTAYGIYDESGEDWHTEGDLSIGDSTSTIYAEQVTDPSSTEITFTGTFSQLRADNSTDYLFLKAPIGFYGNVTSSLVDFASLRIISLVGATGDIEVDLTGTNKVFANSCMFAQMSRGGTIDNYGADCAEVNMSHYFGLENKATYSGTVDISVGNFGVYGAASVSSTYSTTAQILTINAGGLFEVVTDITVSNIDDISLVKNHVIQGSIENVSGSYTTKTENAFMFIEEYITDCEHNVAIFDSSSYPSIFAADNKPLRFGEGTTGTYYESYGDAELYYDGTDFICNPDRIGSGDFKVLGSVNATSYKAGGTAPVADGTYTVGARLTPSGTDGTITVKGGIITAVQQAT